MLKVSPASRLSDRPLFLAFALAMTLVLSAHSGDRLFADSANQGVAAPDFTIEREVNSVELPANASVTVINPFGDVRARFGGYQNSVEVRAVLQNFVQEGPRLEVEKLTTENGLRVVVGYRPEPDGELVTTHLPDQKNRVDLVLFVPDGMSLATVVEDGLTEIKGVHGDVDARSRAGDMTIRSIAGDLHLATDSGSIVLAPKSLDRQAVQTVTSGTGAITVYINEDANFSFQATTQGLIGTDFSLQVADSSTPGEKTGKAVIGKGTTPLVITSASGDVHLFRKPSAALARPVAHQASTPRESTLSPASTIPDPDRDLELSSRDLPARAETVTGDITLWVEDGADLRVELATSGDILVDYSIDIDYLHHAEPAKRGTLVVGNGSKTVQLVSRQGTVRVLHARK